MVDFAAYVVSANIGKHPYISHCVFFLPGYAGLNLVCVHVDDCRALNMLDYVDRLQEVHPDGSDHHQHGC